MDVAGAYYVSPISGVRSTLILGKLPRLAGTDIVVYPAPYGKAPMMEEKLRPGGKTAQVSLLPHKALLPHAFRWNSANHGSQIGEHARKGLCRCPRRRDSCTSRRPCCRCESILHPAQSSVTFSPQTISPHTLTPPTGICENIEIIETFQKGG